MSTRQDFVNRYARFLEGLLGQPPSVLATLPQLLASAHLTRSDFEAISTSHEVIKTPEEVGAPRAETWYPASVSVGGFVYAKVDARYDFGGYGAYDFSAGFWGGFGGGGGGGGGPWVDGALPKDNEVMEFELVMAAYVGGPVQMFFWRKGGPIQGAFLGVIGGLGVGGTKSSGKWRKA